MIRQAAVWMGLVKFGWADVIAGGAGRRTRGERVGDVGREEPNGREKWRVNKFSRFIMKGLGSVCALRRR
jgi:hypothetical protein